MARKRPATTGLLTGYCAAAAGTLVAVAAGGTRHPAIALAILACTAAVVATRVTVPVAAACGGTGDAGPAAGAAVGGWRSRRSFGIIDSGGEPVRRGRRQPGRSQGAPFGFPR